MKKQKGISIRNNPSVRIKNTTDGITLIALVITIIVLLILAGVSISMVIGNNGILNQASTAAISTKNASEKEQVELAFLAAKMEAYGNDEEVGVVAIQTQLNNAGVNAEVTTSEDGKITVKFENGNVYTIEKEVVTLDEEASGTTGGATSLASQITSANYGDYVNYSKDLGLTLNLEGESTLPKTDWRIFYEDTAQDRIYLIAADYVPNTSSLLKASAAGMTTNSTYSLYWSNAPSSLSTVARKDSIFGITTSSYTLNASNANSKCVSTLLDTNNWSNFVDTTVADYAIGGPTIEMYTNSWNAKGYGTLSPSSESTASGYKVNGANVVNISSDSGYSNNLYYPHKSDQSSCYGYWIAAPSANDTIYVMNMHYSGYVNFSSHNGAIFYGVRPVVSLKSGIKATKDANGIWQLGE